MLVGGRTGRREDAGGRTGRREDAGGRGMLAGGRTGRKDSLLVGESCTPEMMRKYTLARQLNCSYRFFGRNVIGLYFDVVTLFLTFFDSRFFTLSLLYARCMTVFIAIAFSAGKILQFIYQSGMLSSFQRRLMSPNCT